MSNNIQNKKLDEYIAVTIATNGLEEEENYILEICALHIKDGNIINKFREYILRDEIDEIENYITEINGITKNILNEKGRPAKDVYKEFEIFIEDKVLIFNMATFVIDFLFKEYYEHRNKIIDNKNYCLLTIDWHVLYDRISGWISLEKLANYYNLNFSRSNGAYNTCLNTYKIYERLFN